jgi:hypothetical protein
MRIRRRTPAVVAGVVSLALFSSLPVRRAAAAEPDFLPALSLHLEAARYAPVETDLHWTATMGGGADVVSVGRLRAYVVGDVETIIGNTRRGFDATQANYHLEAGGRWRAGRLTVNPFFNHVSRHLIDHEKAPAVDWNILGVRVGTAVGDRDRARIGGSVGHTTLASLVGYRWEVTGHGDVVLLRGDRMSAYGAARARLVTVDPDPALPRGDFLDWAVEAGLRVPRANRVFEAFAAHERRNDVFLLTPGARDRALFGVRIRLNEPD